MPPQIPNAKLTLKYTIYAADFDPTNKDFLYVGGGGGEGRSGVKNQITLIDTSRRSELREIVDVELSANEDSVQNLAVAQSIDNTAIVFAGINSSSVDQEKGVNEHFRSFSLRYPTRRSKDAQSGEKESSTTIKALSKAALFTPSDAKVKETYQRLLRLTRPNASETRLGIITTGFAPEGEVIIFNATNSRPDKRDILKKINLGKGKEAADADIIATEDDGYLAAYAVDHQVFLVKANATAKDASKPAAIYETPVSIPATSPRLKFRFIRFLTPRLLIGLLNLPAWGGPELFLLEIDESGTSSTVLLKKTLPKRLKAATTFALAHLPSAKPDGNIQNVIAIGSQDVSITILTLDYNPKDLRNLQFRQHSAHKDLHPMQMTSLAFSTFTPPADPTTAPPQYLKLASTSMSYTVAVQTFALTPYPSLAKLDLKNPAQRYTLIPPGPMKGHTPLALSALMAIITVGLLSFFLQAFVEIRGAGPEVLGAKNWLSDSLRESIARPWMFDDILPDVENSYQAVKDSIPTDVEELQDLAEDTVEQIKNTAGRVQHAAQHQHHKIRDILSKRAEHLATRLTGDVDDEEDEDDDDAPLFTNSYEEPYSETDTQNPPSPNDQLRAIVIKDLSTSEEHSLSTESHHSEEDLIREGKVRKWEELLAHEQRGWLRKLEDAGVWTLEEGETVLKGVFFGQLGGLVAGAVGG